MQLRHYCPTGKGKFLELWAPYKARRPGWVHVAEAADEDS